MTPIVPIGLDYMKPDVHLFVACKIPRFFLLSMFWIPILFLLLSFSLMRKQKSAWQLACLRTEGPLLQKTIQICAILLKCALTKRHTSQK